MDNMAGFTLDGSVASRLRRDWGSIGVDTEDACDGQGTVTFSIRELNDGCERSGV